MTTTVDIEHVTEFARAVRSELRDLGPDTIDELTDGLEADLADKLTDGEPLGDATAYAAELRAAAGISAPSRHSVVDNVRANLADLRSRFGSLLSHPAVAAVVAFLAALRPLWWVLRGWGLFFVLAGFTSVPQNPFDPWLLLGLVVLSIQWGRGRWLPWTWSRAAVIALSVIAALALPALVSNVIGRVTYQDTMNPWDYVPGGLLSNQSSVTNIFAYGPDGELLTGVRLYDQNGKPLSVLQGDWAEQPYMDLPDGEHVLVPSDQAGTEGWNVYPLDEVQYSEISDMGTIPSWAKREQSRPPFASVPQLLDYEAPDPDAE